jgi:hypothetical protein
MLNACRLCGGPAVEQVRGALKKGDMGWVGPNTNQPDADDDRPVHPESVSSNNPANAADTRVACTKCDNATGWNKQDFADYTRFVWDRDNPAKAEPASVVQ